MINNTYIYALLSPDDKIRYIGKTNYPDRRIGQHIRDAKNKIRDTKKNKVTHNNWWIKSLLANKQKPKMKILAICENEQEGNKLEIALIAHYKQFCKLTNHTPGGDGFIGRRDHLGRKHSLETKLKMSLSSKGDLNPARKDMKVVLQLDKDNNLVKEWLCGKDAARELNIQASGIYRCCNNKNKTCSGYKWKFKDN